MTQAEKFTQAIKFQDHYIAIHRAHSGSDLSENAKLRLVARRFYGGDVEKCNELARFVKEKAENLVNRERLLKAEEEYLAGLKKESEDAESEYKNHVNNKVLEASKQGAEDAHKKANKVRGKVALRTGTKILLGSLLAMVMFGGSLAIFSPIVNAIAILLGGLGGGAATALVLGLWFYGPKIKTWWKEKGKKKWGEELDKAMGEAMKAENDAQSEYDKQKIARKSLEETAKNKKQEHQKAKSEYDAHPHHLVARKMLSDIEEELKDALTLCEADTQKRDWARSDGREWLTYGITCMEKAFANGEITDENCKEKLGKFKDVFVGDEGWFKPGVIPVPFEQLARAGLAGEHDIAREEEVTDEGFWA